MDRNEWEIKLMNDNINFRQSNPIEYILKCLMDDIEVEKFDIRNALDQWFKIKAQLSVLKKQTEVLEKM